LLRVLCHFNTLIMEFSLYLAKSLRLLVDVFLETLLCVPKTITFIDQLGVCRLDRIVCLMTLLDTMLD
jgi:hypothetical protein